MSFTKFIRQCFHFWYFSSPHITICQKKKCIDYNYNEIYCTVHSSSLNFIEDIEKDIQFIIIYFHCFHAFLFESITKQEQMNKFIGKTDHLMNTMDLFVLFFFIFLLACLIKILLTNKFIIKTLGVNIDFVQSRHLFTDFLLCLVFFFLIFLFNYH